mmetsp:Transcript_14469/g.31138  ORF Transcript_14469/g.31138 Transcript_14469/m.31138 type:complete len:80 (+) Transcript_14469:293-532(+)
MARLLLDFNDYSATPPMRLCYVRLALNFARELQLARRHAMRRLKFRCAQRHCKESGSHLCNLGVVSFTSDATRRKTTSV